MMHSHRGRHLLHFPIRVLVPPVQEQISLAEAREHMRVAANGSPPSSEEDSWIQANISVSREYCEEFSGRSICPQQIVLGMPCFPHEFHGLFYGHDWFGYGFSWHHFLTSDHLGILIPMAPVRSIDSVSYLDTGGNLQVLDPSLYYLDDISLPNVLYPAYNTQWPATQRVMNAVKINYTAGYDVDGSSPQTPSFTLPFSLKAAMLLTLGHLHENRENTAEMTVSQIPLGAQSLMERYRIRLGIA